MDGQIGTPIAQDFRGREKSTTHSAITITWLSNTAVCEFQPPRTPAELSILPVALELTTVHHDPIHQTAR